MAADFKSVAAMDQWLSQAFGTQRCHLDAAAWHARRALASCPLQGAAYLCLAELSFLDGPSVPEKAVCINQALRVRPFDGAVLFAAGQEAATHEQYPFPLAFQFWRASFQAGGLHQERLINALAGHIPAATLIDLLQPGLVGLERIVTYYQQHPSPDNPSLNDNLSLALDALAKACERDASAAKTTRRAVETWIHAANAYRTQAALGARGRHAEAIRCAREAVGRDPLHYEAHLVLGSCLLEAKDYGEAVVALQWCVQQKPQNQAAHDLLQQAMHAQLHSNVP